MTALIRPGSGLSRKTVAAGTDGASAAQTAILPDRINVAVEWRIAPEDRERYDRWLRCQLDWLNAIERRSGAPNTRRAYEHDLVDFFGAFSDRQLLPWQVTPAHAEGWAHHLRGRGLAPATVNRRIAALSSLYRYAGAEAVYTSADGSRAPLWPWPNPFGSTTLRTRISPYARSVYPSSTQVAAIFGQIDLTTVTGLRNLALIAGLFATTRRIDEWRNLRGGDIHMDNVGNRWFEYRYKGGSQKRQVLPADIWRIIEAYLRGARRWPLTPDAYIFQATGAIGRISPRTRPDYDPTAQPISASYINRLIRRYGAAAGIPTAMLHAHALRHAGARARKEHGATVWELREVLGHSSIAITQIYTETALDQPVDPHADTIAALLPKQLDWLLDRPSEPGQTLNRGPRCTVR